MKKIVLLFVLAVMVSACHIVTPEEPVQEDTKAYEAYGLLTVPSSGFTKEEVRTKMVLTTGDKLDIYMFDVKFATMMPVTIDMVISGVSYTKNGAQIAFSGDSIVPTAGNKPYERYIVTDLRGSITADSLSIFNNYGDTPCEYRGTLTARP